MGYLVLVSIGISTVVGIGAFGIEELLLEVADKIEMVRLTMRQ